jgi:hypothetical protein
VLFDANGPAERIDFFGPKLGSGQPADFALIQLKGVPEAVRVEFGPNNLPESAQLPGGGALRFEYAATTLTVEFTGPDGAEASFSVDLAHAPTSSRRLAMPFAGFVSSVPAAAPPAAPIPGAPAPSTVASDVTVTRAARLDVVVEGVSTLPAGVAPAITTSGCVVPPNLSCAFWSVRSGNAWSVGITHTASAGAGGAEVPASDWPDVEWSCPGSTDTSVRWPKQPVTAAPVVLRTPRG